MDTNAHPVGRRLVAATGVLALSLSGLVGGAGIASADPSYGNIDQNAKGSIIIHKHLTGGDGSQGKPDGSADADGDPLADVTFAAYPITSLDLSKQTDWDTLSNLVVPDSSCANPTAPTLSGQTLGASAGSGTTASNGQATIGDLPVRAYLVCETAAPANVVQKAKPFVATIPYPDNGKWLYDVNVYPKNTVAAIDKTVEQQSQYGYGLGSIVSFPVTTTVPALDNNANFQYFQIKDTMDARFTGVGVPTVTLNGAPLTAGDDYTVAVDDATNTVTVKFTKTGLTKLKNSAGQDVKATFQGTVSSVGDGTIKNTAQLLTDTQYGPVPDTPPDTPPTPPNPPTSPEVQTHWGDLTVHKVDADHTDAGLAGATFQVYNATDPYADDCSGATKTGDPITVNNQSSFTSDDSGVVNVAGLFVSDSKNSPVNATQRCYVLVETAAPAGFVKLGQDTPVTVKTGTTDTSVAYDATIKNTKEAVPGLPLTGAQGRLLMMVVGAVLILTAATRGVARPRRTAPRACGDR